MECFELSTCGLDEFLDTLSESEVFRYEQMYPQHREAFDSYWGNKQTIQVDDVPLADSDKLLGTLHRCTNLKELTMRWVESENKSEFESDIKRKIDNLYKTIPSAVSIHCKKLEVLDLIGKDLTEEDIEAISSLTTLKKIRFVVQEYSSTLEKLLISNSQLEDVYLDCNVQDTFFDKLPNTIKNLHLSATIETSITKLLLKIETMQLDKLSLPNALVKGEDIRRIAKQTTLRSIYLWFDADDSDLGLLFSNNPQLEEVRLINERDNNHGPCLRKLPKTLKKLHLIYFSNLKEEDLVWCFKTCNIEKMLLHGTKSKHNYLPEVVKLATNLKKLTIDCSNCLVKNLKSILQLKQLRKLELYEVKPEHADTVKAIKETLNLEMLYTTKHVKKNIRQINDEMELLHL